jgi:hypothetical protein
LKKVRLVDVLDAIVRVADRPVQYTVEGYAVVFTLDTVRINNIHVGLPATLPVPPPVRPTLVTRAFRVDTNSFGPGLRAMLNIASTPDARDFSGILRDLVFPKFGVEIKNSGLVFYNPITGVLLVRASQEDLESIEAVLEALGGKAAAETDARAEETGGGGILMKRAAVREMQRGREGRATRQ